MSELIDAQRDRALRELHAVAAEAVAAWEDPAFDTYDETNPAVDRLVHAMDALDCVLRGDPAPPKWVPEPCIGATDSEQGGDPNE